MLKPMGTVRHPRAVATNGLRLSRPAARRGTPRLAATQAAESADTADLQRHLSGASRKALASFLGQPEELLDSLKPFQALHEISQGAGKLMITAVSTSHPPPCALGGGGGSSGGRAVAQQPYVTVCFAVAAAPAAAALGLLTSTPSIVDSGLVLHWGCARAASGGWKPPPHGWHTQPGRSVDGGGGAWRTDFAPPVPADGGSVRTCVVSLPLSGPMAAGDGGLAAVLNTSSGRWLKDGRSGANFYLSTASLGGAAASVNGNGRHRGGSSSSSSSSSAPREAAAAPVAVTVTPSPSVASPKPGAAPAADKPAAASPEQLFLSSFRFQERQVEAFIRTGLSAAAAAGAAKAGQPQPPPDTLIDRPLVTRIERAEPDAERSLMHRYNIGFDVLNEIWAVAGGAGGGSGDDEGSVLFGRRLRVLTAWLRFSAARHLTWNRNYNVKPREISAAQERLGSKLADVWEASPELRPLLHVALTSVGRGGDLDVGQRIRDEILAVQARNGCKGGMMEEWHQKLHNNTSPDDLVICRALLAYLESGLQIGAYWQTLLAGGVTRERLASYDRAIRSEPNFGPGQVPGLIRDLKEYYITLEAVHGGDDLRSATAAVVGYSQSDMKGKQVSVPAVPGAATPRLAQLCGAALWLGQHPPQRDGPAAETLAWLTRLMQLAVEGQHELQAALASGQRGCGGRLKDVLFLDIALSTSIRTAVEASLSPVRFMAADQPGAVLPVLALALESVCLGAWPDNEELCICLKSLRRLLAAAAAGGAAAEKGEASLKNVDAAAAPGVELGKPEAMQLVAILDRLKRCLSDSAERTSRQLQPTAAALGGALRLPPAAIHTFSEEVVRGTMGQTLAQLVAAVEPAARRLAGASAWQVISPGLDGAAGVSGKLVRVESLALVQHEVYSEPVVLVTPAVRGEEEVPEGAVAVLIVGCSLDVLCHSAVRARNMRVLMASCFDPSIVVQATSGKDGKVVTVKIVNQQVVVNS